MRLIIFLVFLLFLVVVNAKTYIYPEFTIEAKDLKEAASKCFHKYPYQGYEKGLDVIDVCVNPLRIK